MGSMANPSGEAGNDLPPVRGYVAEKLILVYDTLKSLLGRVGLRGGSSSAPASDSSRARSSVTFVPPANHQEQVPNAQLPDAVPSASTAMAKDQTQEAGHGKPYSVPGLADNFDKLLHEAADESAEAAKHIQAMHEEMAADRYRRQITA